MKHVDLRIEGMTCNHCVMAVRKELQKLQGVTVHDVKIGEASLDIDETTVGNDKLKAAVEEAGYRIVA
jgi:copper chaperone